MSTRTTVIALSLGLSALSAFAVDQGGVEKSTLLKDGSTVHQFKDGKMAMENKFGRAVRMDIGTSMQTANGSSMVMVGDEVARLDSDLKAHQRR